MQISFKATKKEGGNNLNHLQISFKSTKKDEGGRE